MSRPISKEFVKELTHTVGFLIKIRRQKEHIFISLIKKIFIIF